MSRFFRICIAISVAFSEVFVFGISICFALLIPSLVYAQQVQLPLDDRAFDGIRDLVIDGDRIAAAGRVDTLMYLLLFEWDGSMWRETLNHNVSGPFYDAAVDLDQDRLIVGTSKLSVQASNEGNLAFIYEKEGNDWRIDTTLIAPDEFASYTFGTDVAINGNHVAISASCFGVCPSNLSSMGYVYLYEQIDGKWTYSARLEGDEERTEFGDQIELDGKRLVIGAPHESAVYVFEWEGGNWQKKQKLTVEGVEGLGRELDFDSDTIIATNKFGSGVVVFTYIIPHWVHTATLLPPVPLYSIPLGITYRWFGYDTTLSGDIAVIVAEGFFKTHVFRRDEANQWHHQSDLLIEESWGKGKSTSVAASANHVVVGHDQKIGIYVYDEFLTYNVGLERVLSGRLTGIESIYPNPSIGTSTMSFFLENAAWVIVEIYDVLGRRLISMAEKFLPPGAHEAEIDVSELPDGIYFVRLEAQSVQDVKSFVVNR